MSATGTEAPVVGCDIRDGVAWLTINRPRKINALSSTVVREPVSYTHLDVYKRQRSNRDSRSNNYVAGGQGMPIAGMAIARACHDVLMRDAMGCLLYTSRCV